MHRCFRHSALGGLRHHESLVVDLSWCFQRSGYFIDKILHGAAPGDALFIGRQDHRHCLGMGAPFSRRIAEPFDADAPFFNGMRSVPSGQGCSSSPLVITTPYCLHHPLRTAAALLTRCDLLNVSHGARNDFVKPATTSGDGADQARSTFDPCWV
jgi:hypothetical protein